MTDQAPDNPLGRLMRRSGSEIPKGLGALTLSGHPAVLQHADNEGMDTTTRPLLTLVCPSCGATFPSAMQMDPRTFEGIRISNLLECCPKCSRVRSEEH